MAKKKFNRPEIAPSEYACCADGVCPQHEQQGESNWDGMINGFRAHTTRPVQRPPWSEAS